MRITWDSRSIAGHMGGIGHAGAGRLGAFLRLMPPSWRLLVLHSAACDRRTVEAVVPELATHGDAEEGPRVEVMQVEAGFIAPCVEMFERRRSN